MTVKLLTGHHLELLNLKEAGQARLESTLVKMPYRWKSYVAAQIDLTIIETKLLHIFVTGVKHAKEEDLRDMGDVQSG